jgi:hypothetical protein
MRPSVTAAIASLDPAPRDPSAGYGTVERRPLVTFIGGPDTVVSEIKRCRDTLGVGVIDFWFQGKMMSHDRTMRAIELFGKKVLPRIHEL